MPGSDGTTASRRVSAPSRSPNFAAAVTLPTPASCSRCCIITRSCPVEGMEQLPDATELSPVVTIIRNGYPAPVIARIRLRAGFGLPERLARHPPGPGGGLVWIGEPITLEWNVFHPKGEVPASGVRQIRCIHPNGIVCRGPGHHHQSMGQTPWHVRRATRDRRVSNLGFQYCSIIQT